jgi:3-oxoacyl-[acyl-carrier protein] reductase
VKALQKFALITGASGGIGTALAEKYAAAGYSLYLHYNRNEAAAFDLKNRLTEMYPHLAIEAIRADLSDEDGVRELLENITQPVETIVHNSGSSYVGLVTDMDDGEVKKMVHLNVTSPFLITKYLLPEMIAKKHGNIVVISSVWGLTGASTEVLYSTVKGGLNAFVKALAKEVAPSGISVNGIAPGAISTRMLDDFTDGEKEALRNDIPMGRFGKPEEVADLALFLASEKADYINGEIVSINGAWF